MCTSDHRHLFVDLDLGALLAGYPPEIPMMERRVLNTHNPRYIKTYKQELDEFIETHDLLEKQRQVDQDIHKAGRITADLHNKLEDIDQKLTYGRLEAEGNVVNCA